MRTINSPTSPPTIVGSAAERATLALEPLELANSTKFVDYDGSVFFWGSTAGAWLEVTINQDGSYSGASDSIADRPSADLLGNGTWRFLKTTYKSDGTVYVSDKPVRSTQLKIATFGDSTANYGDSQSPANNDTSISTAPMPGTGVTQLTRSIDKVFLPLLYPVARMVQNCGVSGRSVATMVTDEEVASTISTRKVIDAENNAPDIIFFRGGSINDFDAATYPISDAAYNTIVANHKTVLHRLMNSKALIIDEGIYGWSKGLAGYPVDTSGDATRAAIVRFMDEIKAYITSLNMPDKVRFLDSRGINCDATGAYLPGHTTLADGVHNSIVGAYYRALAENEIISSIFGESASYTHTGTNLQINPLFALTGSSGLGIQPTNYTWGSPVNCTRQNGKIELIDGKLYSTMELLVTADGQTGVQASLPFNPTAAGTNPLNIVANDIYGFEVDFYLENLTSGVIGNFTSFYFRVTTYDVTNLIRVISENASIGTVDAVAVIPGRLKTHFATPPIKFQESAAAYGTSSGSNVLFSCNASAGDVLKAGFSNPRIVKL